jgi:hypothetical protein
METEPQAVEQATKDDPKAGLLARRDQFIAQYNQHQQAITEEQQRLGQLQSQQLELRGAIRLINDLIGEQTDSA